MLVIQDFLVYCQERMIETMMSKIIRSAFSSVKMTKAFLEAFETVPNYKIVELRY